MLSQRGPTGKPMVGGTLRQRLAATVRATGGAAQTRLRCPRWGKPWKTVDHHPAGQVGDWGIGVS